MAILMPKSLLIYLSLFFSLINGKKNPKTLINGKKRKERKIKQVENFRVQMIYGLSSFFFFKLMGARFGLFMYVVYD